ncbi:MAG: serine/threonine-protein phosphatase [Chloroflexi bacterium]|nr:serine/threonine-protein phosphatase [Chloroflexota bacterium]
MTNTDLTLIRAEWLTMSLLFVLLFVFSRFDFFLLAEMTPGGYSDFQSSLEPVITWSAVLIFGPSALWLVILWLLIVYARQWREFATTSWHWSCARNITFNLVGTTFASLVALTLYERWAGVGASGGAFPLPGLTLEQVLPAFGATFVWWLLESLIWLPRWLSNINFVAKTGNPMRAYVRFWAIVTSSSILITPFAILAASLYTEHGLGGYLFFVAGVLLASLLAHQLSQTAERSQQRSRELEKLERLGRAIIHAPPDASTLPSVLKEHVFNMFPLSLIEIRIFPAQTLIHHVGQGTFSPDDHPSIADVADKGTGAALYMALSRTLIRTYAPQYHSRPDYVLKVANRRILTDTRADLFVTVFYGIIDTIDGTLTFCNAGHNPPYLLSVQNDNEIQTLTKTGMALGVTTDTTWEQKTIQLAPGDLLVLYTDGITDAENEQDVFFGEERLLKIVQTNLGRPAQDLQNTLMAEIHSFVGDAPQFDDITLMIVVRSLIQSNNN